MSTDVDKRARQIHVNDYGSDKSIFRSSAHTDRMARSDVLFSSYPQGFASGPNASRAAVIRVS